MLYSVIFCGILLRAPEVSQTQRRTAINSAIGNSLTVIPILVYQVLLADKLDGDLRSLPFSIVSIPLFVGLFSLILLSFNSKGGNRCKSTGDSQSANRFTNVENWNNRVVRHPKKF